MQSYNNDLMAEIISQETEKNSEFPALLDEASQRRELIFQLAAARKSAGLTQTEVASRMSTSTSFIGRIEAAGPDCKLSTIQRFAAALGMTLQWQLVPSAISTKRSAA